MGAIVALLNQKGGVGKTSSCHHLAGALAKAGRRVLLVDNDPQASLTQGFWGPDAAAAIGPGQGVDAVYDEDLTPMPSALIRPTGIEGIWIVPGSQHVTSFNMLPPAAWGPLEGGMRDFLDRARDDFDLVLVDNPPNLHLCARASLVAADGLVVPLQAEDYGAQGLAPVRSAVAAVRAGGNPGLRPLGYLVTMFDQRLAIHATYDAVLRESYGDEVFAARFPMAKDFKEAVASRLPITHYKPKSAAAKATVAVVEELAARLKRTALESRGAA